MPMVLDYYMSEIGYYILSLLPGKYLLYSSKEEVMGWKGRE